MTTIGIAIVAQRGRVLVGERPSAGPLAGYAEFPGGKCQPGETPAACALRETLEEAGLRVEIGELLLNLPWEYPHGKVDLHFFMCQPSERVDVEGPCGRFRWEPIERLPELRFPDANQAVVDKLVSRARAGLRSRANRA